jgi:hypothetical protein
MPKKTYSPNYQVITIIVIIAAAVLTLVLNKETVAQNPILLIIALDTLAIIILYVLVVGLHFAIKK